MPLCRTQEKVQYFRPRNCPQTTAAVPPWPRNLFLERRWHRDSCGNQSCPVVPPAPAESAGALHQIAAKQAAGSREAPHLACHGSESTREGHLWPFHTALTPHKRCLDRYVLLYLVDSSQSTPDR